MGAVIEAYEGRVRQIATYENWDEDVGVMALSRVALITYSKGDEPEQAYRMSEGLEGIKAGDAVWVKISVERKGE